MIRPGGPIAGWRVRPVRIRKVGPAARHRRALPPRGAGFDRAASVKKITVSE